MGPTFNNSISEFCQTNNWNIRIKYSAESSLIVYINSIVFLFKRISVEKIRKTITARTEIGKWDFERICFYQFAVILKKDKFLHNLLRNNSHRPLFSQRNFHLHFETTIIKDKVRLYVHICPNMFFRSKQSSEYGKYFFFSCCVYVLLKN